MRQYSLHCAKMHIKLETLMLKIRVWLKSLSLKRMRNSSMQPKRTPLVQATLQLESKKPSRSYKMPNPIEQLKIEYDLIVEYLTTTQQPSLLSDLNKNYRKVLLLSAGSYFEH